MAGKSLMCNDCGARLKSVEEAQEHAELTKHTNFAESDEPILSLVCTACGKSCRSTTERDMHKVRTGHDEYVDKTSEAAAPLILEAPKANDDVIMSEAGGSQEEMVVPEVDENLLKVLEDMGFSKAKAIRGIHYSGKSDMEEIVSWIAEHENDPDIEEMPMVPVSAKKSEAPKPKLTPEEMKLKQQELRERARKKKEEEERQKEREMEKERIRRGKELLEAKRIEEENERKRLIALKKAEKEEEKRAREKIRQKLEEDKAERRRKLGLPPVDPAPTVPTPAPVVEEKKISLPVRPATKAEQMRECLRSLKQSHLGDDTKVKVAFTTLLTFAKNVALNPDEEKYRKIRITNDKFQVGAI
ncbi:OLC1v1019158C2 [Oldenlandia corymbosa var. corymbosa]|uniref:OLC1v1019158C2 n=1 Tax=Oldenlandia corymbosa var. corymbosa TaxID=529605 RepID=A0AAV1EDC3_OLDCO|nr:OLC1v1019158C2 [Oldenlandia corymbosa var. corymbosa]